MITQRESHWSVFGLATNRKGGPSGGAAAPDITNLRGYVEGDNLDGLNNTTLVNNTTVAAVTNLGTLGGMFTQAIALNQPTYNISAGPNSAKSALIFDGTDLLTSSLAASVWAFLHDGTGCTIYTVQRFSNTATAGTIVATGTSTSVSRGMAHRHNTTFRASYLMSDGVGTQINVNGALNTLTGGSYDLFTSTLVNPAGVVLFVNGTSVMTGAAGAYSALDPASALVIGANNAGTTLFTGNIRRIMIYAGVHSAAQQAAVLAYSQALDAVTYPAP